MRDGDTVQFVGPTPRTSGERDGLGLVLSSSGEACHVKWASGEVTMCETEDLAKVKSQVQVSRESSLFFDDPYEEDGAVESEGPSINEEDLVGLSASAHLSSVATGVRDHIVNLVLNDPLLTQAMGEVGEDAMVTMVLSEVNGE